MWETEVERLRKLQAARLREARELRGFRTSSAAARRYGWPVPTYVSHENGTRGIGRKYREYAKKLRVNPTWLLGHSDERDAVVKGVAVVADAAVGTWREAASGGLEQESNQRVISAPGRDGDDRFAVRLADASMNRAFPQGSFAICEHVEEKEEFVVGQVLYVERTRGGMTELSLRRISAVNARGMVLSTYSVDPRIRQELTYSASPRAGSDERITLIGRVVGKYEDFSTT